MSLQLILGRAHSGKSQYVLDIAHKLQREGKPLIFVVPEQFTHLAEKRLISKLGAIQFGVCEVLSFDRIAKRINREYPNNGKHLNNIAKSLIMSDIVSNTELEYYKSIKNDAGFADICISEISEFKKYNLSYSQIFEAAEKTDDVTLSMKLKDLAAVYQNYENCISGSFSDSDDELGILCDNLEKYRPYEGYTMVFDEFSSFNPIEKKIISTLSMQCSDIYMTFCAHRAEKFAYLFKPTLETAASVEEVCRSAGCHILPEIQLEDVNYDNAEMSHLEENIYSYPSEEAAFSPSDIRIYKSENPYSEIANLACQINALVREKNVRYRDIGVICTDTENYAHVFRSVFKKYNIPYFIDEKTEVLKHPLVCFVVLILDVYLKSYNSESVINFIKSGFLHAKRADVINTDDFIRATNASKNVWLTDEKWNKVLEHYCEGNSYLAKSVNEVREKYILPLASLHDSIKGVNTVKYTCEKIYAYLKKSDFLHIVTGHINYFRENGNSYMAKQYESVWKILVEALDMLVEVFGDKRVNLTEFRSYLYVALSQQKIGSIPASLDSIMIGDIKRSKSEFVPYQFIVGAYDGVFPAPNKDGVIVSDADKLKLKSIGIEYSPDSRDKAYFERFLTYSAITHPTKTLVISYPASDTSYSSLRPSFVITLIKNIFPQLKERCVDEYSDFVALSNKISASHHLARSAGLLNEGIELPPSWMDAYAYFKENNSDVADKIQKYINSDIPVVKLDSELVNSLFRDEFYSTISRIQRYNSCRYSYYLEYMLRLKDKKEYGLESTDIGTIVHALIENAFAHMNETGFDIKNADKDYFTQTTQKLFDEYIQEYFPLKDELSQKEVYKFEVIRQNTVNALLQIKTHLANSAFKPIGHEITFDDSDIGCINLELSNGKNLKLTGKIDRADSFENEDGTFIRVIDYKTGKKTFNLTDVYHGLDIQLIVYLNALVKNTPHAHHAGALFFVIQNPIADFKSHPEDEELLQTHQKLNAMTGLVAEAPTVLAAYSENSLKAAKKASFSQFAHLSDYVEQGIKNSALALSDGQIDINPYVKSGSSPCDYCSYSSVCNFKDYDKCRSLHTVNERSLWEKLAKENSGGDIS